MNLKSKKFFAFGTLGALVPIVPVALVAGCDDDVSPAQKAVNDEQSKINALKTKDITGTKDGIVKRTDVNFTTTLATQLGIEGFAPDTTKFTYTVSNDALTANGNLSVYVTVHDKTTPTIKGTPKALIVKVTGITEARIAANGAALSAIVTSSLTKTAFEAVVIVDTSNTTFDQAKSKLGIAASATLPYPEIGVLVSKTAASPTVSYIVYPTDKDLGKVFNVDFTNFAP